MIEFKSITPTSLVLDPFQVAGFLGQLLAESYPLILYPNHIPWYIIPGFDFPSFLFYLSISLTSLSSFNSFAFLIFDLYSPSRLTAIPLSLGEFVCQ